MGRLLISLGAVALVGGLVATPPASAQQSADFYLGGFVPWGLDSRGSNDVLFNNASFLSFDMGDFHGFTFGGDWLVGLGRNFEAGLGLGYYQKSTFSVYTCCVNSNGTEVAQELKLRIVPFTATFRFLPLGHSAAIKPYIGGGVAVYYWRYSETGDWIDPDNNIFFNSYAGSGSAVGPVILGGVRVPVGALDVGGEIRYQGGEADLPAGQGFSGPRINLGGFNYLFLANIRF